MKKQKNELKCEVAEVVSTINTLLFENFSRRAIIATCCTVVFKIERATIPLDDLYFTEGYYD